MRFALINNQRAEAAPGLKGLCPGCNQPVTAKCGAHRMHHWAHLVDKKCDSWWETETEWHRAWKNNFPDDWQEVILPDEVTGEKHIADVLTDYGYVIEFQHSHINPQERISRENFYKNMVWVVDGTRLKNDYKRLIKGKNQSRSEKQGVFLVDFPDECFPSAWLESSAPVVFDFQDIDSIDDLKDERNYLYCLLPVKMVGGAAILTVWARDVFIDYIINGDWLSWVSRSTEELIQTKKNIQQVNEIRQQQRANIAFAKFTSRPVTYRTYRKGRRF